MKKEITTLIIGILIGAVITAGIFLIARPNNAKNMPDFSKFEGLPEGFDKENMGKERPARPNGNRATEDSKNENQD